MIPIEHRLYGRPLLGLDVLRQRATPAAQRTLELAAGLAARRDAEQDAISQALGDMLSGPWSEGPVVWKPLVRDRLLPTDLMRALMAAHGDDLLALLFGDESEVHGESFAEARRRWSLARADLPAPSPTLALPRWWARRWTLALMDDP